MTRKDEWEGVESGRTCPRARKLDPTYHSPHPQVLAIYHKPLDLR
jgi:hypothetical protein